MKTSAVDPDDVAYAAVHEIGAWSDKSESVRHQPSFPNLIAIISGRNHS